MRSDLTKMIHLLHKLNISKFIAFDPVLYWISHSKVVEQYEVEKAFSNVVTVFKELIGMK